MSTCSYFPIRTSFFRAFAGRALHSIRSAQIARFIVFIYFWGYTVIWRFEGILESRVLNFPLPPPPEEPNIQRFIRSGP